MDIKSGLLKRPQSLNFYLYCEDMPTVLVDPTGHFGDLVHGDMTYDVVFEVARDYGYSIAAATNIAMTVADADVAADRVFSTRRSTCLPSYLLNRSHHLNLSGYHMTSMESWASYYKGKAVDAGNIRYLGYGLHSLQDQVAHGSLPIWGGHIWEPFTGYNPDLDLSGGRLARARSETEMYVRAYFESTK